MRDYLFRGKRKYNGEWVYGSLIHVGNFCCILPDDGATYYDYPYLDPDLGVIDGNAIPVIPETVGQFTGICDKNGKKIFEGDIFTYPGYSYSPVQRIYRVLWDSDYQGFYAKQLNSSCDCINGDYDYLGNFFGDRCEIIGNIHDNPELLKGEQMVIFERGLI